MEQEKSLRQLKVQKRLTRVLAEFFAKSEISLDGKIISPLIEEVDISRDLRNAKVQVNFVGNVPIKIKKNILKQLNGDLNNPLKTTVAKEMNLKFAPKIYFKDSKITDKVQRINKIIEESNE